MNDGEFNDISRAIGKLEAGLAAHDRNTAERHQENLTALADLRTDIEALKTWKWKLSGIGAGAGAVGAAVFPYLKKLLGIVP